MNKCLVLVFLGIAATMAARAHAGLPKPAGGVTFDQEELVADAGRDTAFCDVTADSVVVRLSRYIACLVVCRHEIRLGDSAQIDHCIYGGIPPYTYSCSPETGL
jgi:hypothetical protein